MYEWCPLAVSDLAAKVVWPGDYGVGTPNLEVTWTPSKTLTLA